MDLPLFRLSALDIYFGLNKNFFDANKQFYGAELAADGKATRAASVNEIVLALLAGEELSEFMPGDSKTQWSNISKPWIRALQDL